MSMFDRFVGQRSGRMPPASVHPRDSKAQFANLIALSGVNIEAVDVTVALRVLIDFFRSMPAASCRPYEDDGDMLLCQWGVHDWGSGETFEFDFVRQFILAEVDDEDAISQLHLTLHFPVSEKLQSIGAGHRWCGALEELGEFEGAITGSVQFMTLANARPERVELRWEFV